METVNVAETGAEDALYALASDNWSGWMAGTNGYSRRISLPGGGHGEARYVTTYIDLQNTNTPVIITEGEVVHPSGFSVTKQLRIDLERSGLFSNGMTSRNGITMNGNNVAVDSYHSGAGIYDPLSNRRDNGSVASVSVAVGAVSIQNADIYGFVATGGGNPLVGSKGSITGVDTPSGMKIDPSRVARDFYAEFPPVGTPTLSSPQTVISGSTMGVDGVSTEYSLAALSLKSSDPALIVKGDVTLIVSGDIDIKGELVVSAAASLTVYVGGDVDVGGNGAVNLTNVPANLVMFGTASSGQTIKLHGSGALTAAVYAPFADVELKGGGSSGAMYGSVVGNQITLTGNYNFHYDEALDEYANNGRFRLSKWRELNSAGSRIIDILALRDTGI